MVIFLHTLEYLVLAYICEAAHITVQSSNKSDEAAEGDN